MNSKLFFPHAIEERNVFKLLFCVLGSYVVTCNQVFSFWSFRSVSMICEQEIPTILRSWLPR